MKNYTSQSAGQSYSWLCIMLTSHNHCCRDRRGRHGEREGKAMEKGRAKGGKSQKKGEGNSVIGGDVGWNGLRRRIRDEIVGGKNEEMEAEIEMEPRHKGKAESNGTTSGQGKVWDFLYLLCVLALQPVIDALLSSASLLHRSSAGWANNSRRALWES